MAEFAPSSREYDAIFEWKKVAVSEAGFTSAEAKKEADDRLTTALGVDRATAFTLTEEPLYQATVAQLRRLGLPLQRTTDVVELRRQAAESVQVIWRDPSIPAEAKAQKVEETRQVYRNRFAEMFRVPADLLPDETI
jgi:hypothetical protein